MSHPSQRNPAKFGVIRLAFGADTDFVENQRFYIGEATNALEALGPVFIWKSNPEEADIIITHWNDMEDKRGPGRTNVARQTSELDPASLAGPNIFRRACAHEVMSNFGCLHVKRDENEGVLDDDGNRFAPGKPGKAIMNQYVAEPDLDNFNQLKHGEGNTIDETEYFNVTEWHPTQLDIDEFNRVWPAWLASFRPNGILTE